jgi:MFS family permease
MKNKKEINIFLTKYYLLGIFSTMYFVASFLMIIVSGVISNPFHITILLAMYSIVKIIFEIPSGAFADRFGRKNTLILANLIGALAFIFLILRRDFTDIMIFYLLFGLCNTLQSGAYEAFIYDNMKKLEIAKDYAKHSARQMAASNMFFALSALFAAYLIKFGYNTVIISTIFTTFISNILITLTIEDTHKSDKNISKLSNDYWKILKKGFIYSFKHTTIFKFIIFVVLMNAFIYIIKNYFELFLFHITNNLQMVPLLIAIESIIASLGQFFLIGYVQTKKIVFTISITVVNLILALALFVFYSFPISFILIVLFWITRAIYGPVLGSKKQLLIPSKIRATVTSVEGFLLGIAGVIYLLLFGKIVEMTSYKTGFIIASGFTLLVAVAFLFILGFDKHLRRKEARV